MKICGIIDALYSQSVVLNLVYTIQVLASAIALTLLIFLFFKLCTQKAVPLNARLLLANLTATLLLANIGTLFSALYHLHVPLFRAPESRCYWLQFTLTDCFVIRSIFNVAVFGVYVSSIGFTIDRIINSIFLLPEKQKKKVIAVSLIALQWVVSFFILVFPRQQQLHHVGHSGSAKMNAHCVAVSPTPTQTRCYFFAIIGIQGFALATYSILTYYNNFDKIVDNELQRLNLVVFENVVCAERTLPAIVSIVSLFLASVFLDRSVISMVQELIAPVGGGGIHHQQLQNSTLASSLLQEAQWNEFQLLAVPIVSIIFFAIVSFQNKVRKQKREEIYEHINSSNGEDYYENQSDCLSFKTSPSANSGRSLIKSGGRGSKSKSAVPKAQSILGKQPPPLTPPAVVVEKVVVHQNPSSSNKASNNDNNNQE